MRYEREQKRIFGSVLRDALPGIIGVLGFLMVAARARAVGGL